jgi:hypothetical protein
MTNLLNYLNRKVKLHTLLVIIIILIIIPALLYADDITAKNFTVTCDCYESGHYYKVDHKAISFDSEDPSSTAYQFQLVEQSGDLIVQSKTIMLNSPYWYFNSDWGGYMVGWYFDLSGRQYFYNPAYITFSFSIDKNQIRPGSSRTFVIRYKIKERRNGTWSGWKNGATFNITITNPFSISGDKIVCSSPSESYILNSGLSGISNYWTVSSDLTIVSENQNSVTVKAKSSSTSAEGWIQSNITKGTCPTWNNKKNIWAGKPLKPTDIIFFPAIPCLNQDVIALVQASNPAISGVHYEWRGTHTYIDQNPLGSEVHFKTLDRFPYTTYVYVKGTNTCGSSSEYSELLTVEDCGGGTPAALAIINPNPANDEIEVTIVLEPVVEQLSEEFSQGDNLYDVAIYDNFGMPVYMDKVKGDNFKINTSNLKKGLYIISIKNKGNVITSTFIIE